MTGLSRDESTGVVYAFSPRTVFKIEPVNEVRDVWQLYLEKGQYAEAKAHCKV